MPPIFEAYFVRFINEENIPFPPPYLLRLVDGNKFDEVSVEVVSSVRFVVKVGVINLFPIEYLEEVPHRRRSKGGERLTAYRNYESGILVTKLD